mmetsp:Transcript_10173/g.16265  ORF Transcript_10173/g.16265 Transcript_10173/m.16265 type:complete len:153 (-) Transcript_10173:546-1004(-)
MPHRLTNWSFRRKTWTNGSNLTRWACNSGQGLMSAEAQELGQYCPGISIAAEPPPYSPPTPSRAAALEATSAAFCAAFRAIVADEDVDDWDLELGSSSSGLRSLPDEYLVSQDPGHKSGISPTYIANEWELSTRGRELGVRETWASSFCFQS